MIWMITWMITWTQRELNTKNNVQDIKEVDMLNFISWVPSFQVTVSIWYVQYSLTHKIETGM